MNIQPVVTTLESLLTGVDVSFKIPLYQRDYSWRYNEEVEELWNDVYNSFKNNQEYFIGSIVLNTANDDINSANTFDVVDGQQRLTTLSILFSVIRAIAKNFDNKLVFCDVDKTDEGNKTKIERIKHISNERLLHMSEPDHYYLKLNKKDNIIFEEKILTGNQVLLTNEELEIRPNESRIIKTQKTFFRKIAENFFHSEDGVDLLHKLLVHIIKRLKIISIKVSNDYDAYLLFESLNSKGVNLSQSDLIKNKLLMSAREKQSMVLTCWENILENSAASKFKDPVDFLYYYWLAFEDTDITKKVLYKKFKDKIEDMSPSAVVDFTTELSNKSETFKSITDESILNFPPKKDDANQYLAEMLTMGYTICLPTMLYAKENKIPYFEELAKASVNYLFRVITIGEMQVRIAKNKFLQILTMLKDGDDKGMVLEAFKTNNLTDNDFGEKFITKVYENDLAKYVLIKLNIHDRGYDSIPNDFELEHILPQKPDLWKKSGFLDNGRDIETLVKSIGNCTLLDPGGNRGIKDSLFPKKLEAYQKRHRGANDKWIGSSFLMTNEIYEAKHETKTWETEDIIERAAMFRGKAVKIWILPS